MHYIEVHDLGFAYDKEPVLDHITFTVDPGEFVILTGENGSAKSTLLKNILGLLKPSRGWARISKTNVHNTKMQVGYMPQNISSFNAGFPSTVYEFVMSGRYQQGKWFGRLTDDDRDHVKDALQSVDMWEERDKKIGDLSGGQKQRICLARVFCTDPDLFVLDEPTTGMDKKSRSDFYQYLKDNTENKDKSILMVTHEDIALEDYFDKQIHLTREEDSPWRCFSMSSCKEPSSPAQP